MSLKTQNNNVADEKNLDVEKVDAAAEELPEGELEGVSGGCVIADPGDSTL